MWARILLLALLYYPLSIGLTFYQKWFLKEYKLPLLVVSMHYIVKLALAMGLRSLWEYSANQRRVRVAMREQLRWLVPIGVCASLDIGLSNWGLEYVTVSLYTMAKTTCILFIVGFSLLFKLERWRLSLGVEAALIASGLFLFTWRAAHIDMVGLLLIEVAACCAGIRWTVSQLVMQASDKEQLHHPLDMVVHIQPWMLASILPLVVAVEGSELSVERVFSYNDAWAPLTVLFLMSIGGVLAFAMELSEYLLLVNTSGITLNIFGVVKEIVTLLLAHYVNGDKLSTVNVFGFLLCTAGIFVHGVSRRQKRERRPSSSSIVAAGLHEQEPQQQQQ